MNAYQRPNDKLPFGNSPFPWTLRLLVLNALVFFVMLMLARTRAGFMIYRELALIPSQVLRGHIWQLFTYMFLHDLGGFGHIFSNMFSLFIFGRLVEMRLGGGPFLRIYFISGLVAALVSFISFNSAIVGASGAVLGIVMAASILFPNETILLFFVLPLKMRYFAWLTAAWVIYATISGQQGIAHFAHIGGLITGIVMMKTGWYRKSIFNLQGYRRQRDLEHHKRQRERIDQILEKVSREGIQSLSRSEREFLENARRKR